jgi:hypothetical protein
MALWDSELHRSLDVFRLFLPLVPSFKDVNISGEQLTKLPSDALSIAFGKEPESKLDAASFLFPFGRSIL